MLAQNFVKQVSMRKPFGESKKEKRNQANKAKNETFRCDGPNTLTH
ncbi:hypothetical protein [Vibrio sinaloensis]